MGALSLKYYSTITYFCKYYTIIKHTIKWEDAFEMKRRFFYCISCFMALKVVVAFGLYAKASILRTNGIITPNNLGE